MPDVEPRQDPFDAVMDVRIGLVRGVRLIPPLQRYPRLWLAFALPTDAPSLGALVAARVGGGVGITKQSARNAALGETLERYCASFPPDRTISASWERVRAEYDMLQVDTFNLMHARAAAGFSQITASGTVGWVPGRFAHDGTATLAPWSLVCLGATPQARDRDEDCFPGPSISTGLACAEDLEEAALRGLLECCERDAVMLAWYRRDFQGLVHEDLLSEQWPFLDSELRRCGLRAWLLDITTDLEVPSYMCAITPRDNTSRAAFGMSSRLTHAAAAERALQESIHTWMWADSCRVGGDFAKQLASGGSFEDFDSRVVAYGCGLQRKSLQVFFRQASAAPSIRDFGKTSSATSDLAAQLHSRGHPAVIVDITTADVRGAGFSVARCLAPTLQTMEAAHSLRIPNQRRIGRETSGAHVDEPHPFP